MRVGTAVVLGSACSRVRPPRHTLTCGAGTCTPGTALVLTYQWGRALSPQEPAWRAAGGGRPVLPPFSSFGHRLATLCLLSCPRASTVAFAASRKPWFPGSAGVALVRRDTQLQFNCLSSLWGKFRACIWKTSAEKKTANCAVRQEKGNLLEGNERATGP